MIFVLAAYLASVQAGGDLVAPGAEPQKLADGFAFTEGPAVDAAGDVYFTDVPKNRIHKWVVETGKLETFREDSGGANGLYFAADGSLYACEGDRGRVTSIDPKSGEVKVLAGEYGGKRFNKPNDLWIDPKGGVYFTDPNYSRNPLTQDGEHVYYLLPDRGKVVRVVENMKKPNGLIGTPDGKKLYIADPGSKRTFVYGVQGDGTLADGKLFAATGSDGMTLDERGNLYVTAGAVLVFDPSGRELARLAFPESPANVCFGGKDRKTLFVTARKGFYALKMAVSGAVASSGGGAAGGPLKTKVVEIKTVTEEMRYDVTEFTVRVGQPVKLTLTNNDYMPHNLMITVPGAAQEVAQMAEALGAKAFDLDFRPDTDKILHGTKMIDFEDSETLEFKAPDTPGDYDYVCTFPMHWMRMRGVMHVVDGTGGAATSTPKAELHEWSLEELEGDLASLGKGRAFEAGRETFAKLGCVGCHTIRGEGGKVGPDLTEVFKKMKGSRSALLEQILEPSKQVEEKFRSIRIKLKNGQVLFGLVTGRSADHVMIVTNPAKPEPQRVATADIEKEIVSEHSLMPKGLLNVLKKGQILDLLAFLEAGGDPGSAVYASKE